MIPAIGGGNLRHVPVSTDSESVRYTRTRPSHKRLCDHDPAFPELAQFLSTNKEMSNSRINSATNSPNAAICSHNTNSFNDIAWNVNNFGVVDERSEILAWLSQSSLASDTNTFEPAAPRTWGNGCCKPMNFKGGAMVPSRMDLSVSLYFAAAIRQWARPTSVRDDPSEKTKGWRY